MFQFLILSFLHPSVPPWETRPPDYFLICRCLRLLPARCLTAEQAGSPLLLCFQTKWRQAEKHAMVVVSGPPRLWPAVLLSDGRTMPAQEEGVGGLNSAVTLLLTVWRERRERWEDLGGGGRGRSLSSALKQLC